MHYRLILGGLAGAISILAIIPYILSILRGKTKPNRISWLIWSFAATSLSASYYYSGATTTFWITVSGAIMAVSVFALSLKYRIGGYSGLDILCLLGSVVGLGLWAYTRDSTTALYFNIIIDFLAFLPTVKKAYQYPLSENKLSWNIAVIANLCNVIALNHWDLRIALFPVYNLILNFTVAILASQIIHKQRTRNIKTIPNSAGGLF